LSADRAHSVIDTRRQPTVQVVARPLWRLRVTRDLPRYLLYATCALGLLASARFAILPPRASSPAVVSPVSVPDLAARGYATLFARRYLTWNADAPQERETALAAMGGSALEPNVGLTPPAHGAQHVLWAEVVQERTPARARHVYTVAAQTDSSGLVYLTVAVARGRDGRLFVSGYPAFVGAPLAAAGQPAPTGAEVTDGSLTVVVERALRNYLAVSPQELAADLAAGSEVALPDAQLALDSMQRLTWAPDGRSVVAVVDVHDSLGARYTLAYELDVEQAHGRWDVSAIQTDPTS
jgi:hypothetical protein